MACDSAMWSRRRGSQTDSYLLRPAKYQKIFLMVIFYGRMLKNKENAEPSGAQAMSLQSFVRRFEDHSTEVGFQFTFYCDFSDDGYKTRFVPSKSGNKAGIARLIGRGVGVGTTIAAKIPGVGASYGSGTKAAVTEQELDRTGKSAGDVADELAKRYGHMSAEWHVEHDRAFEDGQEEAKAHFGRCTVCNRWACKYCFDETEKACKEHSSRALAATTAAITAATATTTAATAAGGKISCPHCHASVQKARFCGECGAQIAGASCPGCGKQAEPGVKFCGECGTRLQ